MTLYSIDHAVVMDTDDIPGRGGYALVGVSRGVTQSERAYVSQNFGISDYLHDTKLQKRIFYSFFRVPGGRRAFVRRFAKGERRNKTQNRLFVHTLFLDDDLVERLHAIPWLLVNASVRAEGRTAWERLSDDVPWSEESGSLPQLEWDSDDGAADGVAAFLEKRLALLAKQFPSPVESVARVISALSANARVVLPQGHAHELLTTLAWSMLPWRDREEIAWTQHDAMNLAGVAFGLANATGVETTSLDAPAAPFAREIVAMNTASEESWQEFHHRAWDALPSVRDSKMIRAWLALRGGQTGRDVTPIFRTPPPSEWLDRRDVNFLAALTPALADDRSPSLNPILERLLASDAGVAALKAKIGDSAELVSAVTPLAVRDLYAEPQRALPLARELMNRLSPANAVSLAIALASAGEPASRWFRVLLQVAASIDAKNDPSPLPPLPASGERGRDEGQATRIFLDAVSRLRQTSLTLDGAMDALLEFLRAKPGPCVRALILLVEPVWRTRAEDFLASLTTLVEQSFVVSGWEPVIAAATHLRGKGVSALVAAYWQRVDPSSVATLDRKVIDAIGAMNESDRKKVAKAWEGRVRRLPEGEKSDLLVDRLYAEREPIVPLAWREIEQGTADIATLNRLDVALFAMAGPRYEHEMATAIDKFAGGASGARRLARLCALLASSEVLPTVKHVIETHLLRKAAKLKRGEWRKVVHDLRDDELFAPGVASLILGRGIGAGGDDDTIRAFEGVCRDLGRTDVLQAVAAGRHRNFFRWIGVG